MQNNSVDDNGRQMMKMMMLVLGQWDEDAGQWQDTQPQLLLIMLVKVLLNLLITVPCCGGLHRYFMGMAMLSVMVADVALLGGVAFVRTPDALCSLLAHASTMYSALPLPILALGLLDHTYHQLTPPPSLLLLLLLLLWMLVGCYSFLTTEAWVLEAELDHLLRLCPVQDSQMVLWFCGVLSTAATAVLLLAARRIPDWIRASWSNRSFPTALDDPAHSKPHPLPVPLSLALGFCASWAPFLWVSSACWLLDLPAPAYVSINALWLLCANSLLAGITFWLHGGVKSHTHADDTCDWWLFRSLSRRPIVYALSGQWEKEPLPV